LATCPTPRTFAIRVVGGVVTELYGVRNPAKLSRLADPVPLSR
jgi:hypothetical protein